MVSLVLGPNRYAMIVSDYREDLAGRTMEDIKQKAQEIRHWYVAAIERHGQRKLDTKAWDWLLSI